MTATRIAAALVGYFALALGTAKFCGLNRLEDDE